VGENREVMYVPKQYHYAFPTALVLAGFLIRTQYGAHWDVFAFVQLPLSVIAAEWGAYIWQAGVTYQKYVTNGLPQPQAETSGTILDWNTGKPVEPVPGELQPIIRVDGKPRVAYAQVTTSPKMDKVRYVAFTLIRQKQNGFKVDLTEKRWVKNWKFSREEFVNDVIDPWKKHGVIARAGERRNAPYDVLRWEAVQLISQGEHLPRV
jgi:hypothetical protein